MEEKKLRSQMLIDFAKLQSYEEVQIKKLEVALAKAKDVDEGKKEFRKFKENTDKAESAKTGKHVIAKGETELLKHLDEGY